MAYDTVLHALHGEQPVARLAACQHGNRGTLFTELVRQRAALTCSIPNLSMCGPRMSVNRLFFQSSLTDRFSAATEMPHGPTGWAGSALGAKLTRKRSWMTVLAASQYLGSNAVTSTLRWNDGASGATEALLAALCISAAGLAAVRMHLMAMSVPTMADGQDVVLPLLLAMLSAADVNGMASGDTVPVSAAALRHKYRITGTDRAD